MRTFTFFAFFLVIGLCSNAQNVLTVGEVYDFNVGDEFHYKDDVSHQRSHSYNSRILKKWYSKANDTVFYSVLYYGYNTEFVDFPQPHLDTIYTESTIIYSYTDLNNPIADSLNWEGDVAYYTDSCGSEINIFSGITNPDFEPIYSSSGYGRGLGRIMYYFKDATISSEINHQLVYYKKGDIECGTKNYVGIDEVIQLQTLIYLYPNPSNDFVNIELEEKDVNSNTQLSILNIDGRVVYKQTIITTKTELNIANLSKGIYYLTLNNKNKTEVLKLIKN